MRGLRDHDTVIRVPTLAIETSNPSADSPRSRFHPGVALRWSDTGRGVSEPVRIDDPHLDDLASAIERLLTRERITPRDLTTIAVSIGPGGYTATRLAVVTAKMLAEATGARCIGVPTAEVIAARVEHQGRDFAVALASKGETAWVTRFGPDALPLAEGSLVDAAGLLAQAPKLLIADAFLPDAMRRACADAGIPIAEPEFDPNACAEVAERHAPTDPALLLPIYPREPEAVTKWRALKRKERI